MSNSFRQSEPTAQVCTWIEHADPCDDRLLERAKLHILDTFAVAVAGRGTRQVRALARFHDASMAVCGHSLAMGLDRRVEASVAALLTGASAHALDFDDQSYRIYGHSSAVVLPAALALAEENGNTGSELLAAFVVATEAVSKIGRALNPAHFRRGWHSTGTLGAFGAVVACSKLLNLNADETAHALGLAAVRSGGIRANNPTMAKAFQAGQAAQAGVIAAKLAASGVTACTSVLEAHAGYAAVYNHGDAPDFSVFHLLGDPWEIVEPGLMVKQYPACSSIATIIDAMASLLNSGVRASDIEGIHCEVTPLASASMSTSLPPTGYAGKFSIPFCLSSYILHGRLDLDSFGDNVLGESEFRRLGECVTVEVDSSRGWAPASGPEGALLSVKLNDGRRLSVRQDLPLWGYGDRLSDSQVIEKAEYCLSRTLRQAESEFLVEELLELEGRRSLDFLGRISWDMPSASPLHPLNSESGS